MHLRARGEQGRHGERTRSQGPGSCPALPLRNSVRVLPRAPAPPFAPRAGGARGRLSLGQGKGPSRAARESFGVGRHLCLLRGWPWLRLPASARPRTRASTGTTSRPRGTSACSRIGRRSRIPATSRRLARHCGAPYRRTPPGSSKALLRVVTSPHSRLYVVAQPAASDLSVAPLPLHTLAGAPSAAFAAVVPRRLWNEQSYRCSH